MLLQKDAMYTDSAKLALHQASLETFMGSLDQKLIYARRRDEIGPTRPRTKHHGHKGHKSRRRKKSLRGRGGD